METVKTHADSSQSSSSGTKKKKKKNVKHLGFIFKEGLFRKLGELLWRVDFL